MRLSFKQQTRILERCITKGLELSAELARLGFEYDDLRYSNYPDYLFETKGDYSKYRSVDDLDFYQNGIPFVGFFSGAGGLDLGFEAAGFSHLAAIEFEKTFCDTLRANRPNWDVIGPPSHSGDVRQREEIAFQLEKRGVAPEFDGLFVGGPPCQPFSVASNQRYRKNEEKFKRNGFGDKEKGNLLFDFIWQVERFLPRIFLIENVPGLLAIDNGKQLEIAIKKLRKAGYTVKDPFVVNASEFGVPQKRQRVFILGWRKGIDFNIALEKPERVPVAHALGKTVKGLQNHITRNHKAESIQRYMNLQIGQRDPLGRVDRLDPFAPAKTVIAGGTQGGGRSHLHPSIPRTLSVRECARLQTFPDDFVFSGVPGRQFTQVGNAVPPVLAAKFGRQIFSQLFS
ncbi:MAG: DNA (cytosine-5-)-methyltransferase [Anaerolineales bacterium]|nr:DNA (cytosine-5-)-methyltransferase [Anaerolineales bacterium]